MGGRLNWIFAMIGIAAGGLLLFHFFGATWSNRCDPDNARFELLKTDPVVDFQPEGQLLTWLNPRPDNLWLCANANLSVSHVGPDIRDPYGATREDMSRSGWSEIAPGTSADLSVYEKVRSGLKLTAVVRKEPFWVESTSARPASAPARWGSPRRL
jgi:hypothetical protein